MNEFDAIRISSTNSIDGLIRNTTRCLFHIGFFLPFEIEQKRKNVEDIWVSSQDNSCIMGIAIPPRIQ